MKPKLQAFGFSSPESMFRKYVRERCEHQGGRPARFASIGSGNCQVEVDLAAHLSASQCPDFVIDCVDLNPAMLERGRIAAQQAGVESHLTFIQADLNHWTPSCCYEAALANQSLHHVQNLEQLFASLKTALQPGGSLIVSDMIGRNGHQRWPEALWIVQEFWKQLPPSYRFNNKLHRYEESFENRDYSRGNFEGIRAQDILPLLREYFDFELFIAFANVIDPFVDPAFGDNFDAASSWDRDFIDRVHARDEQELLAGHIKPAHMMAVLKPGCPGPARYHEPFSPEFCERRTLVTSREADTTADSGLVLNSYDWRSSPHTPETELEKACLRLNACSDRIQAEEALVEERTAWALRLDGELAERNAQVTRLQIELEDRTGWAQRLDKELVERTEEFSRELTERTACAAQLQDEIVRLMHDSEDLNRELEERTSWGFRLNRELEEQSREVEQRSAWALRLQQELDARTTEVSRLRRELEDLTWARGLDRRFHGVLHFAFRAVCRVRQRLRAPDFTRSRRDGPA